MPGKKILVTILGILILIGGIIAGLLLIKQRQELVKKAAVPGGQATVSLFPTTGNFKIGDSFPMSVYFNTSNIPISGITVRLTYPYSGTTPEIAASNISINSTLERSGDWNCPTKSVSAEGGNVIVDIACANIGAGGFATNTDTLLANFDLKVNRVPAENPISIHFDPSQSIVTQKSNGQDILNIPDPETAKGIYTIASGQVPTSTPKPNVTPTSTPKITLTPTPTSGLTSTPTPTSGLTSTPTVKPTSTPTSVQTKGGQELPSAGFPAPTIIGLGLGVILIISALLLAL